MVRTDAGPRCAERTKEKPKDRPWLDTACLGEWRSLECGIRKWLLEFHLGAGSLELFLDLFGVGLGDVFLNRLRCGFDEILGFLEAQASDGADFFDDADLVFADGCQFDVE